MHHAFRLGDDEHELWLSRTRDGYLMHRGDDSQTVALKREPDGNCFLTAGESTVPVHVAVNGDDIFVHVDGVTHSLRYRHPLERLASEGLVSAEDAVVAPMPGSAISIAVEPRQTVSRGETLMVMESMKMETTLAAPRDGVVETIHVAPGQTFDRDALLVKLAPLTADGESRE